DASLRTVHSRETASARTVIPGATGKTLDLAGGRWHTRDPRVGSGRDVDGGGEARRGDSGADGAGALARRHANRGTPGVVSDHHSVGAAEHAERDHLLAAGGEGR